MTTVYCVHKINPTDNKIEVVALCDDLVQAKIELNEASADYFHKEATYNVVKESDCRINVYLRTNGWIVNGKVLIEILDIAKFECSSEDS